MSTAEDELAMDDSRSGIVKWFNPTKGYGFITDSSGGEIFVHISGVEKSGLTTLYEGQEVNFDIHKNRGKVVATRLHVRDKEILPPNNSIVLESRGDAVSIELIRVCSAELVRRLQADHGLLYQMHPAAFEDLVARIFEHDGFTIEHIGTWNQADGGVDIIAVRKDGLVPLRTAIQCKRYARDRRVTAEPIRSLAGVLDRYQAHIGVLATTSYFTQPATEEARNYMWRIGLQDYTQMVAQLMKLRDQ